MTEMLTPVGESVLNFEFWILNSASSEEFVGGFRLR